MNRIEDLAKLIEAQKELIFEMKKKIERLDVMLAAKDKQIKELEQAVSYFKSEIEDLRADLSDSLDNL